MDIVSCRNLHINLKAYVQQTKLATFYYAHSPSLLPLLVSTETAGTPPSRRFCQLEANQEPLRSAHEETLSINEELQSVHEALSAIGDERRTRPGEVKATTEDPPNSLNSVDAGVASLDANLASGLDSRRSGSPPPHSARSNHRKHAHGSRPRGHQYPRPRQPYPSHARITPIRSQDRIVALTAQTACAT